MQEMGELFHELSDYWFGWAVRYMHGLVLRMIPKHGTRHDEQDGGEVRFAVVT